MLTCVSLPACVSLSISLPISVHTFFSTSIYQYLPPWTTSLFSSIYLSTYVCLSITLSTVLIDSYFDTKWQDFWWFSLEILNKELQGDEMNVHSDWQANGECYGD